MSTTPVADTGRVSLFDQNLPPDFSRLRVVLPASPTNGEAIRRAAMGTTRELPLERGAVLTIVEPPSRETP